jgi:protein tyrosine/serine phosphatase
MTKINAKTILLFIIIAGLTGFALGTLTLSFPVRAIVDYCVSNGLDKSTQDMYVNITIISFVVITLVLSFFLTKKVLQSGKTFSIVLFCILLLANAGSLYYWLNPAKFTKATMSADSEKTGNAEFYFGSIPDDALLKDLKSKHFIGVISLLHPAVVPFEPKLIADEKAMCAAVGIEYISAPMLPWISDNSSSLNVIKQIADSGKGKYYVHCYLGVDRANMVKNFIVKNTPQVNIVNTLPTNARKIDEITAFERGDIVMLDSNVYFTPYPTDEEFLTYILGSNINTVVSILNPKNVEDTGWINKEENLMKYYKFNYANFPFSAKQPDAEIEKIISDIAALPRPVLIHSFLTKSPDAAKFIDVFHKLNSANVPAKN